MSTGTNTVCTVSLFKQKYSKIEGRYEMVNMMFSLSFAWEKMCLTGDTYQELFDDVISHVITPQNAFKLIVKTDFYQVENNQCSQKEIGVMYLHFCA